MFIKLHPLTFSKRIPSWVCSNAYFSASSCAKTIEIFSGNNQDPEYSSDVEQNIQSLRNKLVPDNLIRVLDNTDDLSSAVKVFKWASLQKRFNHTADTYFRIVLKLGLAGNVEEMEGFCQNMVKDRCPGAEEALLALIDVFVSHCRLSEAIRVLVNLKAGGFRPSIEIFNGLLGALVKDKRDFRDVLFVYKEIVTAGIVPTVDTLNYLLEALVEANRIESALDQYRRMKKKRCSPNSRSFEILLKALIAEDRVDEAVIVLNEMVDLGCQPDLSFYSFIIPLFCQENKPDEGIRLFEMMRASNFTPDSLVYEVLLQSLCKNLRLDDAIKVLEEMMETGLTPPNNVFVDVVYVFCKLGKVDNAMKFLEDKKIMETSACNVLLEGFCSVGKFLVAEDLLVEMSERNVASCNSWNIVIRWLSKNGRIREVMELLGRMVVSSFLPDCDTYSALVVCHCKMSNYRNALDIFHLARAKSWVLDRTSYSELVKGLCLEEMTHEATEVFCYMSSNRCFIEPSSFNMLIKGLCETGKVDEAIRMQQLAYYSGTSSTSSTYSTIMLGLSKLDKVKDLLVVFSKMLVEGCNLDLDAFCVLIQTMSLQNRVKECVLLFDMVVDGGLIPDSERLLNLLSCIANHSQLHMISGSINKLISDSEVLNSAIYNVLINGFWKEGYKHEACQFLDLMLEKGWVPDARTHGLLIGSVVGEVDRNRLDYDNCTVQDSVSNILAEGLDDFCSPSPGFMDLFYIFKPFTTPRKYFSCGKTVQGCNERQRGEGLDRSGCSGRDMFEEPLPSIECLEISGKAFPGQELVVCRYGVNGTTVCFFDLGCYVDDGSVSYIDGAKSPNYIVSAADVDTYLGVEVQPMDDRDRREKVVTAALANDYKESDDERDEVLRNMIVIGVSLVVIAAVVVIVVGGVKNPDEATALDPKPRNNSGIDLSLDTVCGKTDHGRDIASLLSVPLATIQTRVL
ncbi:hypothetical protein TB2_032719 [Malus domestica]